MLSVNIIIRMIKKKNSYFFVSILKEIPPKYALSIWILYANVVRIRVLLVDDAQHINLVLKR